MNAESLIQRLEGVKPRGPGRWIARCPAHADKSPSLVISEAADGRILLHCHAGCGAAAVLDSLGLAFTDLYPDTITHARPVKPSLSPADALQIISADAMLVSVYACMMVDRGALDQTEADNLLAASQRITNSCRLAAG